MDILFDLDGTLIDSAPGILASFGRILAARGLAPVVPLVPALIGPPLATTLRRITGIDDAATLVGLAEDFKRDYDTQGYRQTEAYPGVASGLAELAAGGARLFIVTNKRMVPTRRILDALGLAAHFTGVHTRDETEPMAASKAEVVRRVVAQYGVNVEAAWFVGDSSEDADAAQESGLRFAFAVWGYGNVLNFNERVPCLDQFTQLTTILAAPAPTFLTLLNFEWVKRHSG